MTTSQKKSLKQWLTKLEYGHDKKIDLSLGRIQHVFEKCKLGKIAPVIVTVTGTNGKGSTVAILSSICQSAGYKVGEFTSPFVLVFNDQLKINGINATDDQLISAFEKIDQHLDGITLTLFEYTTLAAFILFKQENVEIALLEVGMGGRNDSVNIVDADCAIITTVDIDHTSWLGNDRETIAYEKAGIMRAAKPVIYGDSDCPQSIIEYAQDIKAQLIFAEEFDGEKYPKPNVLGHYQLKNAATSIKALKSMCPPLHITEQNIQQGLNTIELTGRLQIIAELPQIVVDVAHNKQASDALHNWLVENPCKGKTLAVFSVLADKNAAQWLENFSDKVDVWCVSQAQSDRAMPTTELINILAEFAPLILSHSSIKNAFDCAKVMASAEDRIIVFGSFFTVTEVMQSLG